MMHRCVVEKCEDISRVCDSIVDLEKRLFPECWSRKEILHLADPAYVVFCAYTGQQVFCGYLFARECLGEWDLCRIAVDPAMQKSGVGSTLYTVFENYVRETSGERISLELRCSNASAHKFYKKQQFADISVRKCYYQDRQDALCMTKEMILFL